ncbi:head-tail adaptor protein [Pseudomonas turukhanskensis]|uniref:Uncharacterized protein n=1 Tax=Pseudomonas turukhanskensis TaxID=1806536 RepID=A0A9W6NF63_9PSED|nr:head-tail adaptor protein [Pseudomonas turukhanskensis]GLK88316.1 hypothetical protein GCM10017655_13780 [Pseudomonas turukhanskensis]
MEVGRLNKRATILALTPDLATIELGGVWLAIASKDAADLAPQVGVRSLARVDIRARYSDRLQQGRYLKHGNRLFHLTSVRDPTGTKAELRCSADEFVGEAAIYKPEGVPPRPCRVNLAFDAPYRDEYGKVVEYRTKAEVVLIETGRVQADEQLIVGTTTYNVLGYADETDDGIVRGLWLQPMEG